MTSSAVMAPGLVTVHYVIACYVGIAGPEEPVAATDAMAAHWVDPAQLGDYDLAPNIADAVAKSEDIS